MKVLFFDDEVCFYDQRLLTRRSWYIMLKAENEKTENTKGKAQSPALTETGR